MPPRGNPAARRAMARRIIRRRIIIRTTMRIMVGTAMIIAIKNAEQAYKIQQEDAKKIEQNTGKKVEDLTEEELLAAMKKLGIKSLELTDEDLEKLESAQKGGAPPSQDIAPVPSGSKSFCSNCGARLKATDKFCSECGQKI